MAHNLSIEEITTTETFRKNVEVILFDRRRQSTAKYKARRKAGMKPLEDPVDRLSHWDAGTLVKAYRETVLRKSKLPSSARMIVREIGEAAVQATLRDFTARAAGIETENQ